MTTAIKTRLRRAMRTYNRGNSLREVREGCPEDRVINVNPEE